MNVLQLFSARYAVREMLLYRCELRGYDMGEGYIKRLVLQNFKGFKQYEVRFRSGMNMLAGTNNAGKSTMLAALRLISAVIPVMKRNKPSAPIDTEFYRGRGWRVTKRAFEEAAIEVDNLYYDFDDAQTVSITVYSNSNDSVSVFWPPRASEMLPFAIYRIADGTKKGKDLYRIFKERFPTIGAVPTLMPLDGREPHRVDATWKTKIRSKVSSRYFRNALCSLSQDRWDSFSDFLSEYTPEILNLRMIEPTYEGDIAYLNVFYDERELRYPRELRWAGDGFQIWIQILYHIWSNKDKSVVILDEPDVYLHPDLLARLSQLMQLELDGQVVIATHNVELISSVSYDGVVWIDRREKRASRVSKSDKLAEVLQPLGSGFYFTLNRALRQNFILFVEGKTDAEMLVAFAQVLRLKCLSRGIGFSVVPLNGIENRAYVDHFLIIMNELKRDVRCYLLLDGDGRSSEENDSLMSKFHSSGDQLAWHVWKRREMESYLISLPALSRLASVGVDECRSFYRDYCSEVKSSVRAWLHSSVVAFKLGEARRAPDRRGLNEASSKVESRFESSWTDDEGRLSLIDPKDFLKKFRGKFNLSANCGEIARSLLSDEIPVELQEVLRRIEHEISSSIS